MRIVPVAFDSFGTRSMSTFVETKDCKIMIDPGVSLAPLRYKLEPHPIEFQRMDEHWNEIKKFANKADVLIVTHYHYDHHDPNEPEVYKDKITFLKHPTEKINLSQKGRAAYFLEQIKGLPKKLEYSDGKEFSFGNTKIKFSQPVYHGTNPRLGFVVEVLVDDGNYKFIHTSDIEGPSIKDQADFILQNKPNLVILDGPLGYMLGYRYSYTSLNISVENMVKIIQSCPLEALVVDHHFLRDLKWKERIAKVFEAANKKKVKVLTAAEFANKPIEMLEAHRKELYQEYPEMEMPKTRKIVEE
ncbi:MAG: MBL fold metallo-hydrolase [Euryarchaeota archaeon]|nr:MBL fold metallo-hydrolase [Euryarchaeota archaeon]